MAKKDRKIINTQNIQKNKAYYSFIKEIIDEIREIEPKCVVTENQQKKFSLHGTINQMIKKASSIDIDTLEDLLSKYIEKYISMDKESEQWNKIGQIISSLQYQLINASNNKEEKIISKIIEVLDTCYLEHQDFVTKKTIQLFQEYIDNSYSEEKETFHLWNTPSDTKESQPYVITIDEPYSLDLDDSLAVSQDKYGVTLHIYIANTTPFLLSNPEYESIALERYSSLYFHAYKSQQVFHMLPVECAENLLSLKENEVRNVVDHEYYLDYFGNVSYNISYKNITVNKRLSYSEVDELLKEKDLSYINQYLKTIETSLQSICKKLNLDEKYKPRDESRAQKIVSSAAILTNYMTTKEAIKNQYILLYQDYFTGKYSIKETENAYAKVTSPIRRYSDLKNNYLLNRFLKRDISDIEYCMIEKELQDMIPELEKRKERNKQFSKVGTLYLNHKI